MQDNPKYNNLINDVIDYLGDSINTAIDEGVMLNSIVADPGIGFGKTTEHNLEIINRLGEFQCLDVPILIGLSNKSFIGKTLNLEPAERVLPTAVANANAYINSVSIFRCHNTKENKLALELTKRIRNSMVKF